MAKFLSDKEVADKVYQDVLWARDYRESFRERWENYYALYRNYLDRATYPWDAHLAIPTAFSIVEVQTAFLSDMIFEGGRFVEVLGKTPQGQVSARAVQDMLAYHFRHSLRTFEEFEKFIRQLLIFGTSVFKVYWNYEVGWLTRSVPEYENNELQEYKQVLSPEELHNEPSGYTVDLFNFGIDPNAAVCVDARFAFEEMWVDPIKLIERQEMGIYRNVPNVLGQSTDTNDGFQRRMDKINIPVHQDAPDESRGKVHIVDYWGHLTKGWKDGKLSNKAKSQLYHVVIALDNPGTGGAGDSPHTVLLAEPTPFSHNKLPFVDSALNRCVGEFYGQGDVEYCESLFLEERDIRNIQLDNMTRTMNRMFLVNRNADIDEGELVWRPTGVIHVDSVKEDVSVVSVPPVDASSFKAQEDIRRDIEMVTGVNDFVMGQYRSSTGFNDTATGISLIQQVALKRMGHKGQIVQRAIRDVGEMMFALVAQFQAQGTTVRILDNETATQARFIDISPEALRNEYDFQIVNAPSLGSKPLRQNQLIQIFQLLIQLQQVSQQQGQPMQSLDLNRFSRRLLEEMDVPNPSEFFGFSDFNKPINPELGSPGPNEELISPEEENRLMTEQHMMVYPKLEENHPQHLIVHSEAYDQLDDPEAKTLIKEHYNLHLQLAATSKDLIATNMTTRAMSDQIQAKLNMVQGGTKRSPTGASGAEDTSRSFGNILAGNV